MEGTELLRARNYLGHRVIEGTELSGALSYRWSSQSEEIWLIIDILHTMLKTKQKVVFHYTHYNDPFPFKGDLIVKLCSN